MVATLSLALCIFTSCAQREHAEPPRTDASQPEEAPPPDTAPEPSESVSEPQMDDLREYVIAFAEAFPSAFDSTEELNIEDRIGRFAFWQIYYEDDLEAELDSDGVCFITKDRLNEFVSHHFGIEEYEFSSEYPQDYDAELDGYRFLPLGEGPLFQAEIQEEKLDGTDLTFRMKISQEDFETGIIVSETYIEYRFQMIDADGAVHLRSISAIAGPPEGTQLTDISLPLTDENDEPLGETIDFTIHLPVGWTLSDTSTAIEFYDEEDILVAEAAGRDLTFEDTDSLFSGNVNNRDFYIRAWQGKYYHMQSTITEDGLSVFQNVLMYCLNTDNGMIVFTFYPYFGTGIGTQSDVFESYLNTIELAV
jgi:hypothetical protein